MIDNAQSVRNLLGQYCERMDLADWEGIGALFEHGALADEHGTVLAAGGDAVAAFYRAGTQLHDGSPRTKHQVSNTILEVDDDAGTATARSSYVVLQGVDGSPLQPIIAGRYRDAFERHDGTWRFAERRFLVDLVGDLSAHLTFTIR